MNPTRRPGFLAMTDDKHFPPQFPYRAGDHGAAATFRGCSNAQQFQQSCGDAQTGQSKPERGHQVGALTPAEIEQVRSAGKNIALDALDRSELKNNVADAEVILGVVDRETMLAAKKLNGTDVGGRRGEPAQS